MFPKDGPLLPAQTASPREEEGRDWAKNSLEPHGREGKALQKATSAEEAILSQWKAECWMASHGTGAAIMEDLILCAHFCLPLSSPGFHPK